MSFFQSLAAAFKGVPAEERPPLDRSFVSPWYSADWRATGSLGGEARAPFHYVNATRAAYLRNPVAQRAVRLVADGVAGAPLTASDPALLALLSETSAGQALLETLASQVLLHGNGYVQVLRDDFGRPVELFALRPERVTVQPDAQGWPASYIYQVSDQRLVIPAADGFGRANVVHVKDFHPLDDHHGAGCLAAADEAVAIHNAAAAWNLALLENAARPSGALVYDPGDPGAALTADQFERVKAELALAYAGHGNAGRPLLLDGGLKWQAMSLTPADMDFATLKAAAARDIALAFGVPPMMLGLPGDSTYNNYREANRALWRLTILPLAGKLLGALAQGLADAFPGATLAVDLDKVPALADDRETLWSALAKADFLTSEEKRAMLGLASPAGAAL